MTNNNNNLLSVSSLALCLTQQITYTSMSAVSWGSLMCLISHLVINNVVYRCHHSDLQLASRPLCQGSTCSHWMPTSADLSVPVPSAPPVPALLPLMHTLLVTANALLQNCSCFFKLNPFLKIGSVPFLFIYFLIIIFFNFLLLVFTHL